MAKKVIKKAVVKKGVDEVVDKKEQPKMNQHIPFVGMLALVIGVSGYAVFSSFASNNSFLNYAFTDISDLRINNVAIATKAGATNGQENQKPSPFSDVKYGDPNANEIIALYYAGVVNGYGDGTYKPQNKVNRAEFMKMLAEARDVDYTKIESGLLANCFGDVKDVPEHWYAPPVCAGKYYGWVNGYPDGTFKAIQNINKAEALKITLNAFGLDIPANGSLVSKPFVDVEIGAGAPWYAGVAQASKNAGLILLAGNFDAGHELTRGEMASIIYKAMLAKADL